MPAQTKSELLDVTEKEFAKLDKLVSDITPDRALKKREEETSIKDVIAHRAHWIELFLGWYQDGQEEKEVYFPAKGYKWNDLKRYNADLRERQLDLGWSDAITLLKNNHNKLVQLMESLSQEALYGAPMKGANNNWTTGRWAEAAGPSHYRSAAKYLRACIKTDKS